MKLRNQLILFCVFLGLFAKQSIADSRCELPLIEPEHHYTAENKERINAIVTEFRGFLRNAAAKKNPFMIELFADQIIIKDYESFSNLHLTAQECARIPDMVLRDPTASTVQKIAAFSMRIPQFKMGRLDSLALTSGQVKNLFSDFSSWSTMQKQVLLTYMTTPPEKVSGSYMREPVAYLDDPADGSLMMQLFSIYSTEEGMVRYMAALNIALRANFKLPSDIVDVLALNPEATFNRFNRDLDYNASVFTAILKGMAALMPKLLNLVDMPSINKIWSSYEKTIRIIPFQINEMASKDPKRFSDFIKEFESLGFFCMEAVNFYDRINAQDHRMN